MIIIIEKGRASQFGFTTPSYDSIQLQQNKSNFSNPWTI